MNNFKLEERLENIERLLLSKKNVLTLEEVCEYTGFSKSFLYKLTSEQRIPHFKPGGKNIFFSRKKLEEWMMQNEIAQSSNIQDQVLDYILKKPKNKKA